MKFTLLIAPVCLASLLAASVPTRAVSPLLSATVGSGIDESYLVLDFQNGTPSLPDSSYAFGYLYSPSATGALPTGLDMVNALSAANIGFSTQTTTYSFGTFINGFTYNGLSEQGAGNGYWAYFTAPDGQAWTYSGKGAGARTLTDGSYDGWSYVIYPQEQPPVTPLAAVPEPGAGWLALLGLPVLAAARRRRVRH